MERSSQVSSGCARQAIHDAVDQLGWAVHRLVKGLWQESWRLQAEELAECLVAACTRAGLRRAAQAARALQSLMKFGPRNVGSVEETLHFKLFELLGLVRVLADAESASDAPSQALARAADPS